MKGLLIFLMLAGLIVLGFLWLGRQDVPQTVQTPAAPVKTPWVSTPVPATPRPIPTSSGRDPVSLIRNPNIRELAMKAGVQLVRFDRKGPRAEIIVEWSSDNTSQGMDFVDLLLAEGIIRDIDVDSHKFQTANKGGRRVMTMGIEVMF